MIQEKPKIACLPNGPYYLINSQEKKQVENLQNSKEEKYSNVAGIALCRCGSSKNKPFCDGTHGVVGFTSERIEKNTDPKKRDYKGQKIIIHDNRAVCHHSENCIKTLSTVFNINKKPWIDPDSDDVEKIIKAVKKCPSGALSYTLDGKEYKDYDNKPMVTVSKDGPYLVTGGIELIGEPFLDNVSKEHYSLCRCGASKIKPFCDGSHHKVDFKD
jgi:CDGSH-type Zn-finger protein/ferredoxin